MTNVDMMWFEHRFCEHAWKVMSEPLVRSRKDVKAISKQ